MAPQCTALSIADERKCTQAATSSNGLFCAFHNKQCYGLYKGYKTRNARLDALVATPPKYIAESKIPLLNQTFADVETEPVLRELHDHLFSRYALLDRVIRARKLHHSRFYSLKLDYGHQVYLDKLQSHRTAVLKALERLERRTAEVLFKRQKWFKWVRQCQDDEEAQREGEKKKVKLEAAMFRRHWKDVQSRLKALRAKEEKRRQDEFLDQAYNERKMQETEAGDDDEDDSWDPIEDVLKDERGSYIDLIKYFLWIETSVPPQNTAKKRTSASTSGTPSGLSGVDSTTTELQKLNVDEPATAKKKKRKPRNAKAITEKGESAQKEPERHPEKESVESRSEMASRLRAGEQLDHNVIKGVLVTGKYGKPKLSHRTAPLSEGEIESLLDDVAEIKKLLFCRALLSQATLLPSALRAESIEDFLADQEISDSDLRDLCLKMEKPGLQEIRDACADLIRGEDEYAEDDPDEDLDLQLARKHKRRLLFGPERKLPDSWLSPKEEEAMTKQVARPILPDSSGAFVDFGVINDDGVYQKKRMRVNMFGKHIWNYASETSMARSGWLQFSVFAKDCSLHEAITLCRTWDEAFEVNILACNFFFPSAKWAEWAGNSLNQQLFEQGFMPFFIMDAEEMLTKHQETFSSIRGPRQHVALEVRNFIGAQIKRNDPISRRLIQYLAMQTWYLNVLVRDAKTGKILVKPDAEELWFVRSKNGLGKSSKTSWKIVSEVGPKFFADMEEQREWRFGFNDYYDVYLWDKYPGAPMENFYNRIQKMILKARRVCSSLDIYRGAAHILKTITYDRTTARSRTIRPGESAKSTWDGIVHACSQGDSPSATNQTPLVRTLFYSEADAAEDLVLFPEEFSEVQNKNVQVQVPRNPIATLEDDAINMRRFILDIGSDEEFSEEEECDCDQVVCRYQNDDLGKRSSSRKVAKQADKPALMPADDEDELNQDTGGELDEWEDVEEDADDEEEGFNQLPEHARLGLFSGQIAVLDSSRRTHAAWNKLADDTMGKWINIAMDSRDDMGEEFEKFRERETANAFKKSWHMADADPASIAHFEAQTDLVASVLQQQKKYFGDLKRIRFCADIINWLKVYQNPHRWLWKDIEKANVMVSMFFEPAPMKREAKSGNRYGLMSLLSSMTSATAKGAKHPPSSRSSTSSLHFPASFYTDWDKIKKKLGSSPTPEEIEQSYPPDWDLVVRPAIANLYRSGIIRPSMHDGAAGEAIAATESGRAMDFFIDFRMTAERTSELFRITKNPYTAEKPLSIAQKFARIHPNACFAFFRIWSHAYFWPLMTTIERREDLTFVDGAGRLWEWKFISKDMAASEHSIQTTLELRLAPFKSQFGQQVFVWKDTVLVMGRSEEDLKKLATATVFAIQARPWRLEVDLWKSFVNVDVGFLERLDEKWLE
ncbi:hypothetical protein K402DRAFT_338776 [Aulographum hederae CBS 113979]|uniref:Mfs allantoate protein n=1 Tax=Aulographum hederae CBS 113979 TaxID=1176131 RepID=A0A6G1GQQ6_9PEZI|nr:hypothetical protein K402DRAFT_338776 [Aulographum hederae CBS 113979]